MTEFCEKLCSFFLYFSTYTWRMEHQISTILNLLEAARWPLVHIIPHQWLKPASMLATHAANLHIITLFHVGHELPKWIMKC